MHKGVDLKAYYEPVFAMADGVVKITGYKEREGNYIVITHGDVESIYCHLCILLCKQGQYVKGGNCIGVSGNSGFSTGPHFHFGVKSVNYFNPKDLFNPKIFDGL